MPIIGVTHTKSGEALVRRSVTCKVAIGKGPTEGANYPKKLDHFILLRKATEDGTVDWVPDEEKTLHYGDKPTELTIILLDDDVDEVFRTEYAWWTASKKQCHGDGERASREGEPHRMTCANSGKCKEYEDGQCKPSADLYFMLADYPSLGTVCRLHTSSYQSVREIYSALNDLKNMMGGRLMGLPVKLFVRPEKNTYKDSQGRDKVGTKYVLGLELRAESLPKMLESVAESARVFAELKRAMGNRNLQIEEDDDERAPEIAGEFHQIESAPAAAPKAQLPPPPPEDPATVKFNQMADAKGLNTAKRNMLLAKHDGNLEAAMAALEAQPMPPKRTDQSKRAGKSFHNAQSATPAAPTEDKPKPAEAAPVEKYTF